MNQQIGGAWLDVQDNIRRTGSGLASWHVNPNWNLPFTFSRENQVGTRPHGMCFGNSPSCLWAEIRENLDYFTNTFKASTDFGQKSWALQLGCWRQSFENNIRNELVENPWSTHYLADATRQWFDRKHRDVEETIEDILKATTSRFYDVGVVARFRLSNNLFPKVEYRYQHFDYKDFQTSVMNPYAWDRDRSDLHSAYPDSIHEPRLEGRFDRRAYHRSSGKMSPRWAIHLEDTRRGRGIEGELVSASAQQTIDVRRRLRTAF